MRPVAVWPGGERHGTIPQWAGRPAAIEPRERRRHSAVCHRVPCRLFSGRRALSAPTVKIAASAQSKRIRNRPFLRCASCDVDAEYLANATAGKRRVSTRSRSTHAVSAGRKQGDGDACLRLDAELLACHADESVRRADSLYRATVATAGCACFYLDAELLAATLWAAFRLMAKQRGTDDGISSGWPRAYCKRVCACAGSRAIGRTAGHL